MKIIRETLTNQVVSLLKGKILRGELQPGSRVWAANLAEEFDVSIAPVKEALVILQMEGLIVNIPRRGSVVRQLTLKEASDLSELRLIVEEAAVRRGVLSERYTPEIIGQLAKLNLKIRQEVNDVDGSFKRVYPAFDYDTEFHHILIAASGNKAIVDWYKKISIQALLLRFAGWNVGPRGISTYNEHESIIQALRGGDADIAAQAIGDHILTIGEVIKNNAKFATDSENDFKEYSARRL